MDDYTSDRRGVGGRVLDKDGVLARRWMEPLSQTVLPSMNGMLPAVRSWAGLAIMTVVKVPLAFQYQVHALTWAADAGLRLLRTLLRPAESPAPAPASQMLHPLHRHRRPGHPHPADLQPQNRMMRWVRAAVRS
ncbi:hypothetical protein [Streptomyces sp. NPDC056194]|uniref:hypothetical protein n=1 Tax=unclassified Streptomyces TaxID=2593676 RepID=UPI0035E36C15